MHLNIKKQFFGLILGIFALILFGWFGFFCHSRKYIIYWKVSRTFLFLLTNSYLIVSSILLFLIIRQSIKLFYDFKILTSGFNDMTVSLQRAYKRLETQNKEMLTMLEHIKESVFFIDSFGRIVTFNDAAKKLIKKYISIKNFKDKKISFFGEKIKNTFFLILRELVDSKKGFLTKEVSFEHENESRTFRIYFTVIQNALFGTKNGVLVVVDDLSEVYKMNKIKTWQEAAKQMAHEVKNPLTPIQLATQRLQRKLRKSNNNEPVFLECVDTILHQVKTIKDLVSNFSEFARMPGSDFEVLDINKIVKEVCYLYEMGYSDIIFSYDLQDFMPSFRADKKKLKRVIVNLLDNSIRALRKTDYNSQANIPIKRIKLITIRTRFKTNRNQIEFIIADNGPGIPREVKENMFLPYVSTTNKNTGLGLAIVHDIVTQAGGNIKLLQSNEGATFQVLLPV